MFKTKVLTAVLAIPVVIALLCLGGIPLFSVVTVAMLLGMHEFYRSVRLKEIYAFEFGGYLCAVGIAAVTHFASYDPAYRSGVITACLAGSVLLTMVAQFWRPPGTSVIANSGATVFGVVWIALLFSFMLRLRMLPLSEISPIIPEGGFRDRAGILFLVILTVCLQDSAAQITGMLFGRHRPWPNISPGKSLEGCIGGFTVAVVTCTVAGTLMGLPTLELAGLGIVLGVFGQLGDFCKSMIKRELGIKDFGTLIPGHGGVLDRFDSLLFTMPIAYLYFRQFAWVHGWLGG